MIKSLLEVVIENAIDILATTETESLDTDTLVSEISRKGVKWKLVELVPSSNIKLFAKDTVNIVPIKEEKHFSCYKINENKQAYLLFVVHLSSAMFKDERARSSRAMRLSDYFQKIEEETFKNEEYKSIILGDFNLQPFSEGIASAHGFNATMSANKAQTIKRVVDGEKKYFYFNPMWKLMGDNKKVQGTYYNENDQQDLSMFWYSFDEVLIRPYFINKFNWDSFSIIEQTQNSSFLKDDKIDKSQFSDHLPLKFEIE